MASYSRLNIDGVFSITLHYHMNKEPHLKIIQASCMLVLLIFASFFGSEGTLLCIGKDGHVAVEFVDACNGTGLGSQLAGMESDACGPCTDVQFLSSPIYKKNDSHHAQTLPLSVSSPSPPSLPLKEYSCNHVNLPNYSHEKILASLHTVILLI